MLFEGSVFLWEVDNIVTHTSVIKSVIVVESSCLT